MNLKIVIGASLIALLSIGAAAFAVGGLGSDSIESSDPVASVESKNSTADPGQAGLTESNAAASEEPGTGPVASIPAMPEGVEGAELVFDINKIIAEVTQEAAERPKDHRMKAEEVTDLLREQIDELVVRP